MTPTPQRPSSPNPKTHRGGGTEGVGDEAVEQTNEQSDASLGASQQAEEFAAPLADEDANGDEEIYVAKVRNKDNVLTQYKTLQEAVDNARGGQTVSLLVDVSLSAPVIFPANKQVDINLVGHNITADGIALVVNGATSIQDTTNTGKIESTNDAAVAVGNNAKVTVVSGTIKGREGAVITGESTGATIDVRFKATLIATDNAVIADNGSKREGKQNTINIKGSTFNGKIESEGYIACGIYAPWNDKVTISGGTFNIEGGVGVLARAGNVTVSGGIFNCTGGENKTGWVGDNKNQIPCAALVFDKAANYPALTETSQILVSGGTFSTNPAAHGATLKDGYVAVASDDGMYKVSTTNPAAEVNGGKYETLQGAINAAQTSSGTVKLLKDISDSGASQGFKVTSKVDVDLNNHNITWNGQNGVFDVTSKGDLTIKGSGTITAVENNNAAVAVWTESSAAKVTLEGGTYKQQITNTDDTHFDLIYAQYGTVYVKGGTYECATPAWTLNCKDENYKSGEASIEVTGGTFKNFDPSNNKAEGEGTNFVADGYCAVKSGDDSASTYTVTKALAQVLEADGSVAGSYATLSDAVNAAQDGQTVKLLADSNGNGIAIKAGTFNEKGLTIDFNGCTYMVGGKLVGSHLTATNAFQLNKDNILRFVNGSIVGYTATDGETGEVYSAPFILIQNYSNLTLDGMTLSGGDATCYTLSNNCGNTVVSNSTINIGKSKGHEQQYPPIAFDVCRFSEYSDVSVTVEGNSRINGDIELSASGAQNQNSSLVITGGYVAGSIKNEDPVASVSISGGSYVNEPFASYIKEGYQSVFMSNGLYAVVEEGEETGSEDGSVSGSVATDGVTVGQDEQKQLADSAADVANALKEGESAADANKIGDVTVDTAKSTDASKLNDIKNAARADNASVEVTLVVKADTGVKEVNDKIADIAKANNAATVPFTLCVDMVTKVTDGDKVTTASLPVKETADPIEVTIAVEPASIKDKRVVVARVHDGVAETIEPKSVNYTTGEVTFETGKFSDYAVVAYSENQSYELADFTDENGNRKAIADTNLIIPEGYTFAGWYQDPEFRNPYTTETKGTAYPKFVEISDLIQFEGGSLRMDWTGTDNYEKTSLRFGYEMHVPEGAKLNKNKGQWGWTLRNPENNYTDFVDVENYWLTDGNGAIANVVISPIYRNGDAATGKTGKYTTEYESTAQVSYITKDGTSVVAKDEMRTRSVNDIAIAITQNTFASDEELAYANGILGK